MATGFFKRLGKIFSYSDGTYDRASMGDLAAYTGPNGVASPAQAGFRVIGADGNAIFDSLGLIDVCQSAGFAAAGSAQSFVGAGSGSFADVTASSFTAKIPRDARIDYRIMVTGFTSAGAGSGYIRGKITSLDNGTTFDVTASIIQGTAGNQSGFVWYFTGPGANFATIPAGNYTFKMQAGADVGTTWRCVQFFHQVFIYGA